MAILLHKQPTESIVKHSLNNLSEANDKLWKRLNDEDLKVFNFKKNINSGVYKFDFYSNVLNFGIQLDAYSFCYDETFNTDGFKMLTVSSKSLKVIKLTDYQIIIDTDQVVRFLKNQLNLEYTDKMIA